MLYLAEVQKKTGFIGSGKAEFKLLACQRGEQAWSAVPGEEIITAPDDASYNAGALVMVDLNNNRQVQRHYEAGRSLVSILQNFSNLSKKFKTQEEEIEQWKQSLTFQSQELNRREMEIETRQEQVEQAEVDLDQLESQRQAVEQARSECEQARQELDRKRQELEGAWAHLNGEMRLLNEKEEAIAGRSGLDQAQVDQLQDVLNRLTGAVTPTEAMHDQLHSVNELVSQQQDFIEQRHQSIAAEKEGLEQRYQELSKQRDALAKRWEDWHQSSESLVTTKLELKNHQGLLLAKQERIQLVSDELHRQGNLHQRLYDMLNTSDKVRLSKKVDVATLEAMPLDDLQVLVRDLEKDLEKVSRFVSDQEEELTL